MSRATVTLIERGKFLTGVFWYDVLLMALHGHMISDIES